MSDTPPLIFQRMADIFKDVTAIAKSGENKQQHFKFRGIEDVMNALHACFKKHEVFILTEIISHECQSFETKSGTKGYHHQSRVKFRFVTVDGSECSVVSLGEAMDYGDKGATKTISISLKYALTTMFLIPTKEAAAEDPDAQSHEVAAKPKAPKLTPSEAAEAMAVKNADKKWMEISWPWSKPEDCAKKPLSDLAANANVDALTKMKEHFGKLITDKTPELVKYVDKVGMALTEANSTAELTGKDNGSVT